MEAQAVRVIKQRLGIFLVEIEGRYFIAEHDPKTYETRSVFRADFEKAENKPYSAAGWNAAAIEAVAKGRKKETAKGYFNEALRIRKKSLGIEIYQSVGKYSN